MTTIMFPGQGSQSLGMGKELFDQYGNLIEKANAILNYDVRHLCEFGPTAQLNNTQYTQAALYVIEAMYYLNKESTGLQAEYSIGHSLGEYSALFAAKVFDFETGLKLVKKRGELMAQANNGTMVAVLGLTKQQIASVLQQNNIETIDFANLNAEKQIVLSGLTDDINKACHVIKTISGKCIPLKVSGAFHSRYMSDFTAEYKRYLESFHFNQPRCIVLANANVEPYHLNNVVDNLVIQLTHSVHWSDTIKLLKSRGQSQFIELGPNNVLTRLLKHN